MVLTVVITDINDNDPQFLRSSYNFQIEENKPRNTTIGEVQASDRDINQNAQLLYSIVQNTNDWRS